MHEDLSAEEYEGWRLAYHQDPWGPSREDSRSFVQTLWMRWHPQYEGEEPNLPEPHYPYWRTKEEKTQEEVDVYEQNKARAMEAMRRLKEKKNGS